MLAPTKTGKTAPPIPHIAVAREPVVEPAASAKAPRAKRSPKLALIALLLVLLLGGGGYFAYLQFKPEAPPPPPVAKKETAPTPTKKSGSGSGGDAVNRVSQAPKQAINRAQDAIDRRNASGQTDVGAIVDPTPPATPPPPSTKTGPQATQPTTVTTQIAQGVSATMPIEATAEASPAFRAFVQNAKISGVYLGANPVRAFVNGQLARAGITVVEPTLGIVFERVDVEKRLLIFKDKTGATVSKKF